MPLRKNHACIEGTDTAGPDAATARRAGRLCAHSLRLAVLPLKGAEAMLRENQPLLQRLSEATGVPVELVVAPLQRYFGALVYAGTHDKALQALLEGRVDAYLARHAIDPARLQVLWRSAPIY